MITQKELESAISELENAQVSYQTCSKLADLYIILDHLKPAEYAESSGKSEFYRTVNGKEIKAVMAVMDELMEAIQALSPRLYENVIWRLNAL